MTLLQFQSFIQTATTEAGFSIDPNSFVFNNDELGNFISARGIVKSVNPQVLGQGPIGIAIGAKQPIQDMTVIWDVNGKPKNAPLVLSLCTITPKQ